MSRRNSFLTAVLFGMLAVAPAACSSVDNEFSVESGLCYRTRTTNTAGCQTHREKTKALQENCGLPKIAAEG